MHQPKLGNDLVLVDVEPGMHEDKVHLHGDNDRPGVHEEVVHLHEGEDHVEDGVDARENVPGTAAHRNLRD